jgi:hypothetical protein
MRIFLFLAAVPLAFGQLFSAGVKIGVPLTDPFANSTTQTNGGLFSYQSYSDAKKYIVGPMVELHLPFGFSINADGLYRPLRLVEARTSTVQTSGNGVTSADYGSWEVTPVLRYRFLHTPIVKPFAEGGPSFRWVSAPLDQYLSSKGFTLGAGVEVKLWKLAIAPELRVTRWGSDHNLVATFPLQTGQNQAEFLVGVSF